MVPGRNQSNVYGEVTNETAAPDFTCVPTAGVEPVTARVGLPVTPLTVRPKPVRIELASATDFPTIDAGIVTGFFPFDTVTVTVLPFAAL
jgi:hypothetical protein